jgi:FkbM family methyltransferase
MFFPEKYPKGIAGNAGEKCPDPVDRPADTTHDPAPITRIDDPVFFLDLPTPYRQITDVSEYQFDDIGPEDIVIDIGANIGAFSIRASRRSKHVFAVEPLTAGILRENIELNKAPVTVIEAALGNGKPVEICWDTCRAVVQSYTLREIIRRAGGCTFLKCDCEGAEWQISPGDLDGIRRIEMELHLPPISGPPNPALLDYISRHFHFSIERKPVHSTLGVMGILHAIRKNEQ